MGFLARSFFYLAVGFAVVSMAGSAAAQAAGEPLPAMPTSAFLLNTFHPSSTTKDGFMAERGAVLDPLSLDLRILFQFDDDPLTRQQQVDSGFEQTKVVVQRQWALHLGMALGLLPHTQLGVQLPVYLSTGLPGEDGGVGDLALVPKAAYRFDLPSLPKGLGVGLLMPLTMPTGDEHLFIGTGSVTAAPQLALDVAVGAFAAVFNFGAWLRRHDDGVPERGTALISNGLLAYDFAIKNHTLRGLIEVNALMDTWDLSDRGAIAVVGHGGLRYHHASGFCVGAALGAGLTPGVGSPDGRLLVDVGWTLPTFLGKDEAEPSDLNEAELDTDLDGIADGVDKCPAEPEDFDDFEDEDGCPEPDNDADGIGDSADKCPLEAENLNGLDDEDGCPEHDRDLDRVPDDEDLCPDSAEDFDGFEDDNGCPDEDNDLDGVVDTADKCPLLPSPEGNADGCPRTYTLEGELLSPRRPMRFEKGTIRLVDPGYDVLEQIGAAVLSNPQWSVRIEVHANGAGKAAAQLELTRARADALRRLLILCGVIAERIEAVGRGNEATIAPSDNKEGRRLNERVLIRIVQRSVAGKGGTP